ncbi:MAG: ribose 5-phosphate isomerase B [Clostridiales bacterium]|jgi:ribose 5-phosphate isomerase B|nr:ribose 5-phosphate isomerase B [Clostridiales bacterium]
MKIIIGSDHAGYPLKEAVRDYLTARDIAVNDIGATFLPTGELIDPSQRHYPLVAERVAVEVAAGNFDFGILCCGTGIGIGISANKIPGIRAATCSNHFEARYSRLHNDANILCLGARVIAPEFACELVDTFLHTDFEGGRHALRTDMIRELEYKYHR